MVKTFLPGITIKINILAPSCSVLCAFMKTELLCWRRKMQHAKKSTKGRRKKIVLLKKSQKRPEFTCTGTFDIQFEKKGLLLTILFYILLGVKITPSKQTLTISWVALTTFKNLQLRTKLIFYPVWCHKDSFLQTDFI